MKKILQKLKNNKFGFSLVELIVVIAIMAVIAAVLVPSLLMHVERSRAEKDIKTTDELVTAVELALADQDVYDELVEHSVWDNVSCYVDRINESDCSGRIIIKEAYNQNAEQYMFEDDARLLDEVPYYGAGNMRGLTITFSPEKDSNESTYELSRGIINRFIGRKTGYLYENEKLYNAIRSVVGDVIYNSSQTYRNSDFTIFIRLGSAGGNEAGNQDATQVWGQYNGTNLPANIVQTAKITEDRNVGDAGQYDAAVNEYINDEENINIDFSQLAAMGGNQFGEELEALKGPQPGFYDKNGNLKIAWKDLISKEYQTVQYYDDNGNQLEGPILNVDSNGVLTACFSDYDIYNYSNDYLKNGTLVIDESVKKIGNNAFCFCFDLEEVVFPSSIETIGKYSFGHCALKSVVIPEGTVTIENSAFTMCEQLKTVELSNTVKNIKFDAFGSAPIESITIPKSVIYIEGGCFANCSELISIIVDAENQVYDSRNNCNAIIETSTNKLIQGCNKSTIPDDVVTIGQYAFYMMKNLKNLNVPNSVSIFEKSCFSNCINLVSINIPYGTTSIGNYAFNTCNAMKKVYFCFTSAPTFGEKCFYKTSGEVTTFNFKNSTTRNAFTTSYYNASYGTKSSDYNWTYVGNLQW